MAETEQIFMAQCKPELTNLKNIGGISSGPCTILVLNADEKERERG